MAGYRRILSVVDPAFGGALATVERAAVLASAFKAKLAVIGAADHPPGSDQSLRAKASLIAATTALMERLVARAGGKSAEIMAGPRDTLALTALAITWRPDLIVVAADALPGLRATLETSRAAGGNGTFDLLSVEPAKPGLGQRLASAVAGML